MPPDKELMGASTSLLLLSLLAESPSYGYELIKRLAERSDHLFDWQEGTVYPVLHRLEKQALVRPQWQDADTSPQKSPRKRKYYYITAKGRRALADQHAQWSAFHALIQKIANPKPKPA